MTVFIPPGPAEILRAVQKDKILIDLLEKQLNNLLIRSCGTSAWLQNRQLISFSSKFLYYAVTTLSGFQTLGEEYTNIVQVDLSLRHAPSFKQRLLLAILDACGFTFVDYSINKMEKKFQRSQIFHAEFKNKLIKLLIFIKTLLPFLVHFHHTIFYWNGFYYDVVKRLLRIRYVSVKPWLSKDRRMYGFKILAVISLLHLFISFLHSSYKWFNRIHFSCYTRTEIEIKYSGTCSLCLEFRTHTSATSCGHLFCWYCILNWLQMNNQCPICRDVIEASRIVPLLNYN